MRVPNHLERGGMRINMTPMIDVVFLLIIFFLVSVHLKDQVEQPDMPLPAADSGQDADEPAASLITLNVMEDGRILWAGSQVAREELQRRLTQRREAAEEMRVRIRGNRNVAYQSVEPVLLACARAGIWDVSFAVFKREDP